MQIVECVPNFSEGNDMAVIKQITDAIESVQGVQLLDVDPGESTNRTVVTFIGEPEPVAEAAFRAVRKAAELIDMSKHSGEHARFGATDVCPFVPVAGATMEDCVTIARAVGERIAVVEATVDADRCAKHDRTHEKIVELKLDRLKNARCTAEDVNNPALGCQSGFPAPSFAAQLGQIPPGGEWYVLVAALFAGFGHGIAPVQQGIRRFHLPEGQVLPEKAQRMPGVVPHPVAAAPVLAC